MNISSQNDNSFANVGTQTGGLNFSQGGQNSGAQTAMSFKEQLAQMVGSSQGAQVKGGTLSIDELLKDMDFARTATLESVRVDEQDAKFFLGLLDYNSEQNRISEASSQNFIANINSQLQTMSAEQITKSQGVSKTMMDLLNSANSTNKPVRIDFDNDITLVLRVDREGKLSAQFYPGDKAAEEYLKNNIPYLKNRFDEQSIPYKELSYKQHQEKEQQKQHKENKKDE